MQTNAISTAHSTGDGMPRIQNISPPRMPCNAAMVTTPYTLALTCIAIVAVVVVVWVARRLGSLGWSFGLGFLLAGVAGNLTDRIFRQPGVLRGHVVDFFMFPNFPVFNVADICINIAAGVIILQALRGVRVDGGRHEEPARDREPRPATDPGTAGGGHRP